MTNILIRTMRFTHHTPEDYVPMVSAKLDRVKGKFSREISVNGDDIIVRTNASATSCKKIIASLKRGDKPRTLSLFIVDAQVIAE